MSDASSPIPTLFHDPTSEPSRAVHWFALEAGVPIGLRYTWLTRGEHWGKELLAVNPRHQLPALRHGDFALSEATAIMRYLAEIGGVTDRWFGGPPRERARIEQLHSWYHTNLRLHGTLEYFLPVLLGPGYLGEAAPSGSQVDVLRRRLREVLEEVERFLEDGPYLAGERIAAPDFLFGADIFAFDCDPDRERYMAGLPRVSAWLDRLMELESWGMSHLAWNAVAPVVRQRLTEGVAPCDPGWVAEVCERVLGG
jgi:glutathione S-transferase